MKILVASYQHETNTFAPSPVDWAAFNRGDSFPAFVHGAAMLAQMRGVNIMLPYCSSLVPVGGLVGRQTAPPYLTQAYGR